MSSSGKKLYCNYCGIPEAEWKDGKCFACGNGRYCDVRDKDIIEQRVYDWAVRQNLLNCKGSVLYPMLFKRDVERMLVAGKKVPQYIIQFVRGL